MAKKKESRKVAIEAVRTNRKRLLTNESPFAIKEAYVKLRTSLMFCMTADKERPCTSFAVTSAKPSEGKSLTAANIAISYAMFEDEYYLKTQMEVLKQGVALFADKYRSQYLNGGNGK